MYCTLLCWKEHSNTMPILSQTAQVYLGISRPCRMAGLILNGKRSFLRPDKRNKLVFIRASFHIFAGSCPSVTARLTLALPRRQWRQHHPNWKWQDQKHQSINQYAVKSVHLSNSNLESLSHSSRAISWKQFGTNDVDCINDIQRFTGYLPLVTEIDARRVGFLYKIESILLTKYNITRLVYNNVIVQREETYALINAEMPRRKLALVRLHQSRQSCWNFMYSQLINSVHFTDNNIHDH